MSIGWFALRAAAVYSALVIPWSSVFDVHGAIYRSIGNAMARVAHVHTEVQLRPASVDESRWNTVIVQANGSGVRFKESPDFDARLATLATALLIALVLALPWPKGHWLRPLVIGIAALHCYIALRLGMRALLLSRGGDLWPREERGLLEHLGNSVAGKVAYVSWEVVPLAIFLIISVHWIRLKERQG